MAEDLPPLSLEEAAEPVTRGVLRAEMRGQRTRVLIEDLSATVKRVLERLADAVAGNAQVARIDAEIADVRPRADAAAALAPRVQDHERRIRALEEGA